jgi:hypothetical protein
VRAEGEASALLTVLEARGTQAPDAARARSVSCADYELMDVWAAARRHR